MVGERGWGSRHSAHAVLRQSAVHAPGTPVFRQERRHHGCGSGASMQTLNVSLVQGATRWHDAPANREYYGALVRRVAGQSDLIVLPETLLSGFSNDTQASAEDMDGD